MNIIHGNRNRILSYKPPRGEQAYITVQTDTEFIVPNVTTIIAVSIQGGQGGRNSTSTQAGGDGGDLRYVNNLSVTPGETLTITVGGENSHSEIKRNGTTIFSSSGTGSTGGYNGGNASGRVGPYPSGGSIPADCWNGGGGGGAGGYTGYGGSANGGDGSGGGAGGGAAGTQTTPSYSSSGDYYYLDDGIAGGGTGIFGKGSNGTATGGGGSGGGNANGEDGGLYGGGGGGAFNRVLDDGTAGGTHYGGDGGDGALRIVWGAGRAFPSTDVALTV